MTTRRRYKSRHPIPLVSPFHDMIGATSIGRVIFEDPPSPPAMPMPRFTDLMIDMEGLNCTPDSAPAQIALMFFNRDDASTIPCSYTYDPSPISAIRLGFTVSADTLKWWDNNGMVIDIQAGEPLADVLDEMANDIKYHATANVRVWSRGNTYDLAILKLAYNRTGKTLPWNFWMERDVRTWLEGFDFKSTRKNDHNPLTDARNQTLDILQAMHGLAAINPASV
jgi:hypothetical protein